MGLGASRPLLSRILNIRRKEGRMPQRTVCPADQISSGEMKKFDIDELEVTVANVGGEFLAFEWYCSFAIRASLQYQDSY